MKRDRLHSRRSRFTPRRGRWSRGWQITIAILLTACSTNGEDVLWILPPIESADHQASSTIDRTDGDLASSSGASVGSEGPDGSWYTRPIQQAVGRIESFDRESCRWTGQDGRTRTLPANRVLTFRHRSEDPEAATLVEALDRDDFDAAFAALPAALRTRPPIHAQQDWVMRVARLAWASGRFGGAESLIKQLDVRPLPPCVVALLPLVWVPTDDATTMTRLRSVLAPDDDLDSPLVRLLRASALVYSGRSASAVEVLAPLRRHGTREEVRVLATWLSVAAQTPQDFRGHADVWIRNLSHTPVVLGDGPRRLMIHRLAGVGRESEAERLAVIDRYAWANVPPP